MSTPLTNSRSEECQDSTMVTKQHAEDEISAENTLGLDLSRKTLHEPSTAESVAALVPGVVATELKPLDEPDQAGEADKQHAYRTKYLVLLCALLTSLSFGVTQVPMLYVFRLMTCSAYYEAHPQLSPQPEEISSPGLAWSTLLSLEPAYAILTKLPTDRCSIRAIESSTALSISLLGASTTVFGLANLFLTGLLIKRIGVKPTLVIQVFFPAIRLFVQNVGVEIWGNLGIVVIQCSQFFTILGGPSGYILVLNTFMTEIVEHEGRTAALGRLQGTMMFGSALGFLLGGILADTHGISFPFRLTLLLFLCCSIYVAICLPHVPPAGDDPAVSQAQKKKGLLRQFLSPLTVFTPKKFVTKQGSIKMEHGAFRLAIGVYLGILATGYLPTLLQLYATDVFFFGTSENGWLIFTYSMLRGTFLAFAFPQVIALGRKWVVKREERALEASNQDSEQRPLLSRVDTGDGPASSHEPSTEQTFTFDLIYTRFSLGADGLLTLLCSLVRQGWQMYLVATILPLSAGTSSAAKGTILQMIGASASSSERTDALAGISLVENMARLSTTFAFGVIFAAFASIGKTELVFTCNAAVALIGFCVLLFARFPPAGSRAVEKA